MTIVPAQVTKMMHININVSDYNASKAFYEQLGFRSVFETEDKADAEAAVGLGMLPYELKATPRCSFPMVRCWTSLSGPTPWTVVHLMSTSIIAEFNRAALSQPSLMLRAADAERGTAFQRRYVEMAQTENTARLFYGISMDPYSNS